MSRLPRRQQRDILDIVEAVAKHGRARVQQRRAARAGRLGDGSPRG